MLMADERPVTRFAITHPWLWGVAACILLAGWGGIVVFPGEWWPWIAGLVFGLANALAWRGNGPARRLDAWLVRRYPKRR